MMFDCGLQNIFQLKNGQSRSINWENRNGEKGKGGMASSDLGPSRKGSPCIPKIEAGETVTLGEIQGEGMIQHIWITVTDRTSERNRYVLRDLVLRMYWDDEKFPSVECRGFIKQYLQKLPQWGRFGVTSVTPFLLLPVHPEGCTPAHRT